MKGNIYFFYETLAFRTLLNFLAIFKGDTDSPEKSMYTREPN